jgi:DNA (cytosine-5)-methyltransferase 1
MHKVYSYFVKALKILKPKAFIFENVPGLKSANGGLAYETILDDFRNLSGSWKKVREVIGAKDEAQNQIEGYEILFEGQVGMDWVGVPQSRRRIIIVGARKDLLKDERSLERSRTKVRIGLLRDGRLTATYPITPMEAF